MVEVLVVAPEHGDPIPGHYRIRLVKGGPWVAARITYGPPLDPIDGTELDRAPRWNAYIDGDLIGEPGPCPHAAGAFRIWPAHAITQADHDYLVSVSRWAREHSPRDPAVNPRQAIDPMTAPLPF